MVHCVCFFKFPCIRCYFMSTLAGCLTSRVCLSMTFLQICLLLSPEHYFLTATGKQKVYCWYTVLWRITSFTANTLFKKNWWHFCFCVLQIISIDVNLTEATIQQWECQWWLQRLYFHIIILSVFVYLVNILDCFIQISCPFYGNSSIMNTKQSNLWILYSYLYFPGFWTLTNNIVERFLKCDPFPDVAMATLWPWSGRFHDSNSHRWAYLLNELFALILNSLSLSRTGANKKGKI